MEFGKVIDRLMASGMQNDAPKEVTTIKKTHVVSEEYPKPYNKPEEPCKDNLISKKPFNFFGKKEEKIIPEKKKKQGSSHVGIKIPGMDNNVVKKPVISDEDGKEEAVPENPKLIRKKNGDVILLDKNHFKLRRKKDAVDYCIQGNNTVGRNHADIIKNEMGYCIIDNDSKNHTYINGRKITSGVPVVLKHADRVTLSNEEFVFYLYEIKQ